MSKWHILGVAYYATLQDQEQNTVAEHKVRRSLSIDNIHNLYTGPGGRTDFLLLKENIPLD